MIDYEELVEATLNKLEEELNDNKSEILKNTDFIDDQSFAQLIQDTLDEVRHHTYRMLNDDKNKESLKESILLTLASELFKEPAIVIMINIIESMAKGETRPA